MGQTFNQPEFWLEIKKEYIKQNFNSLFRYLKKYNYDEDLESTTSDFNTTFKRLKEVVDDYFHELESCSLSKKPSDVLGDELPFAVSVIATYLLTTKEKKHKDDLYALCRLGDALLLEGQATTQTMKSNMKKLILHCLCGHRVTKLGYSWTNLEQSSCMESLQLFCGMLSQTQFDSYDTSHFLYEGKGFLHIIQNTIQTGAMSYSSYKLQASPNRLSLPFEIEIISDSKTKYSTFNNLLDICQTLSDKQRQVVPTPLKAVTPYEDGEDVIVEVYKVNAYELYARTIDEKRKKTEGRVKLSISKSYGFGNLFNQHIKKEDHLFVQIQTKGGFPFLLEDTFSDFYHDYLDDFLHSICKAKFMKSYNGGMQYLTEHGFLVNIPANASIEEDQLEARESNLLINVSIDSITEDNARHTIATGSFFSISDIPSTPQFDDESRGKLIRSFVDASRPDEEKTQSQDLKPLSSSYIPMLSHSIYYLSEEMNETDERYKLLQAAYMLLTLVDDTKDIGIVKFEMEYLNCLARFAQGGSSDSLQLQYDSSIELSDWMERKLNIINSLRSYQTEPTLSISDNKDKESENQILDGLINASNLLIGKINHVEIDRIKRKIASNLGVSDIYESSDTGDFNYGEESHTLEFKSSFVYPPNNKMQPDIRTQKTNVLKAVCGMLNSDEGGDILLGVDDYGYPRGLDNDISYLYSNRTIRELSMDKLRLFVNAQIDESFECESESESCTQITGTRVVCNVEKHSNSREIIRIHIIPYEYGIVTFRSDETIPEDVRHAAFFRRGGQTIKMETSQCREQLSRKLQKIDPDKKKFKELEKAIQLKKVVILKNYLSKNNEKNDRHIEAYQLIKERRSLICYDLDRKDLREFKTTRFDSVEITDISWSHTGKHKTLKIDAFDMLEKKEVKPTHIKLKLKVLAYNLLAEEYKQAKKDISANPDNDSADYPYLLDTRVFDIKGVGRFYIGLSQEIKLVEGKELKEYARAYVEGGDIYAE